jgi:nucleotide-binding universal stress UspA family protein
MTTEGDEHRIVVGVDGSVPSKAALLWAVEQARLTGAVVEAVIAWEIPLSLRNPWPTAETIDFKSIATHTVADAIAEASGSAGQVEIRPEVVEGNAAQVLLDASAGADLLVVGSRGHGGFVGALLGSVSQHCVLHSSCPVVVIRHSVATGH